MQDDHYWVPYLTVGLIFLFTISFCGGLGMGFTLCTVKSDNNPNNRENMLMRVDNWITCVPSLSGHHSYSQQWTIHPVQPGGSARPHWHVPLGDFCDCGPSLSIPDCEYNQPVACLKGWAWFFFITMEWRWCSYWCSAPCLLSATDCRQFILLCDIRLRVPAGLHLHVLSSAWN